MRPFPVCLSLVVVLFWPPPPAASQPLGTFTWQLQPFCNRVTVSVRQDGAVYTLDGTDDQCGAAEKAPLVGLAALNPDGSIGFGLNIVAPTGQPVPVQARIAIATLSGTWRDAAGSGGTFAFGGNTGGAPRPLPNSAGDITEVTAGAGLIGGGTTGDVTLGVDPAVVQTRVTTACEAGQALRSINQNGTAVCEPVAGGPGDITAVHTGAGLAGGSTTGMANSMRPRAPTMSTTERARLAWAWAGARSATQPSAVCKTPRWVSVPSASSVQAHVTPRSAPSRSTPSS
jgi:hypothetical protein